MQACPFSIHQLAKPCQELERAKPNEQYEEHRNLAWIKCNCGYYAQLRKPVSLSHERRRHASLPAVFAERRPLRTLKPSQTQRQLRVVLPGRCKQQLSVQAAGDSGQLHAEDQPGLSGWRVVLGEVQTHGVSEGLGILGVERHPRTRTFSSLF